jgi:DNA-binding winged helix-turn-helix (wHTH) protein
MRLPGGARPVTALKPAVVFGPFRLELAERRLERDGKAVQVGGRALDILIALAAQPGRVVSKAQLSEAAWPGMVVEEAKIRSARHQSRADGALPAQQ